MARRNFVARGEFPGNRSIETIITDYKRFVGLVETEVERIMQNVAEMTLEATLPYVPVQYGGLKESGRAKIMRTDKGVMAMVTFGGDDVHVKPTPNAPLGIVTYAAVVNYDMNKIHNNGQAMFLQAGASDSKDQVDAYIKSELKKINPKRSRSKR